MRFLLAVVLRLVLLAVFTFGFVVLFEHGPAKFSEGAKTEWNALLFFVGSVLSKQERPSAPAVAAKSSASPTATPAAAGSPSPKEAQVTSTTNHPARSTPAPNR
jgi:hypothetical protein